MRDRTISGLGSPGVRPDRYPSLLPLFVLLLTSFAGPLSADSILVGTATANAGGVAVVPVRVADSHGTPLGADAAAGMRIQAIALKVSFSPADAVASATIVRSGILQRLTPLFETSVSADGSVSWVVSFSESTDPIPFALDSSAGDEVALIRVTLAGSALPGTTVSIDFDSARTELANQAGTVSETSAGLTLSGGSVEITAGASASTSATGAAQREGTSHHSP